MSKVTNALEDDFLPDPRFGKLADRFLPVDQQPPADEDWLDRRFSQGPVEASSTLRNEIVRFANQDPDARQVLQAAGICDQSEESIFRTRTKRGAWEGFQKWDETRKHWVFSMQRQDGETRLLFIEGTPDDSDAAKAVAMGKLVEADSVEGVRVLGPDQYLLIQRIASRDLEEAFAAGLGMLFADCVDATDPSFNPYETIAREEYQPVLRELCWVIFLGSRLADSMSDSDLKEFARYAETFIGTRPWNLSLLKSASDAFKNERVYANLKKLDTQPQQPEPVIDYDSLSDEEIDQLHDSVSREYAKMLREQHRQ